ncbi:hypothetical protein MXB_1491, partial [Myxobolus squamalis]
MDEDNLILSNVQRSDHNIASIESFSSKVCVYDYDLSSSNWLLLCEGNLHILKRFGSYGHFRWTKPLFKILVLNHKNTNDFLVDLSCSTLIHIDMIVIILVDQHIYGFQFNDTSDTHQFYLKIDSLIRGLDASEDFQLPNCFISEFQHSVTSTDSSQDNKGGLSFDVTDFHSKIPMFDTFPSFPPKT